MISEALSRLGSWMDAGRGAGTRLAVLCAVLLFFLAVHGLRVFLRAEVSASKVGATIKLAIVGLVLLLLETQLGAASPHGNVVADVQGLVVMLCLANLVTYLAVDLYCHVRMKGEVPSFVRDLLTSLVYIAFALASLRVIFRIDVSSILTTTTVLTAAVAFAMQTTIANIVSGFYVERDENLKRNAWISIKDQGITGEIVNVGFRYVTLRTLDNHRVMVPNNFIMQNVVSNLGTRGGAEKSAAHLKVGLGYDMPPEKAVALMTRILAQEEHVARTPAPTVILSAFLDSSVEYDLKYFLDDWAWSNAARGSILSKLWYAVTREGYSFPFPHREVIAKTAREPFERDEEALLAVLRRTDILRSLGEEQLRQLSGTVQSRVFGPGEVVVQQDDQGDSLFIVRGGVLSVLIGGTPVGSLREGEIFGEMSLLTGERRKATVIAAGEVHLVELSKEHLAPVIKASPDLLEQLSAILAQREEMNVEHRKRAELSQAGASRKEAFMKRLKAFFDL